jgi:hypothetical protein
VTKEGLILVGSEQGETYLSWKGPRRELS